MAPLKFGNPTNGSNGWIIGIVVLVVILIIGVCWCNFTDSGKSAWNGVKSKFSNLGSGGASGVKELDIVMFMSPTCPWCKKMIGVLESSGQLRNITVVDRSKPEGEAMAKQFGADKQPVPSFISRTLKTGAVGYRESVQDLIKALKQPQAAPQRKEHMQGGSSEEPGMNGGGGGGNLPSMIQGLQIVLFARDGCGYCTKAKEALGQYGVAELIQVIDIMSPEGQQMAAQLLPPGTSGVPAWVSMATKKHTVGFGPQGLEAVIQQLS